jgi:hypothetical protein
MVHSEWADKKESTHGESQWKIKASDARKQLICYQRMQTDVLVSVFRLLANGESMKIHFVTDLVVFIWYYKYLYFLFIIGQTWYIKTWYCSRLAFFRDGGST